MESPMLMACTEAASVLPPTQREEREPQPLDETALAAIRDEMFALLDAAPDIARHVPLKKRDVGYCICSRRRRRPQIDFDGEDADETLLTDAQVDVLERISSLAPAGGVVVARRHAVFCKTCWDKGRRDGSRFRFGALVRVLWHGRLLSREYALPDAPTPAPTL